MEMVFTLFMIMFFPVKIKLPVLAMGNVRLAHPIKS